MGKEILMDSIYWIDRELRDVVLYVKTSLRDLLCVCLNFSAAVTEDLELLDLIVSTSNYRL